MTPIHEGFVTHYARIYGSRWPALYEALRGAVSHTTIEHDGKSPYYLDEASVIAAKALPIVPGMDVADLCAAPGGKTLVLAAALDGEGKLVANEWSRSRRDRLKRVIAQALPDRLAAPIVVTGHDATKWCLHEQEAYDAILLDVPCSAERHLIADERELARWSPSRTKRLAMQGYAMLASALEVVRPGGMILYSTCSISPHENDRVVERLLSKRSGRVEVVEPEAASAERTSCGRLLLPDICGGRGPIYLSLLRRWS